MSLTIADLFSTPDHYLMAFDRDQAVFAAMNRTAYHRSVFLDGRIARASPQQVTAPTEMLLAHRNHPPLRRLRTGWIFHVAHCGSTLLARALDRIDASLVLREPMALRQLAVAAAGSNRAAAWRNSLDLTVALAGRRYCPPAATIVKANVPVNFIIPDIMNGNPADPAILLYYPFEPYLLAILRSPNHRRWVQAITTELQPSLTPIVGEIAGLDDVERAAALWLAQMIVYTDVIAVYPGAHSLDAEALFAHPSAVLAAASTLFGSPMTAAQIESSASSALFATYSKDPSMPFDNDARLARQAEQSRIMASDLVRARRWLAGNPAVVRLPASLGRTLLGDAPPLLLA